MLKIKIKFIFLLSFRKKIFRPGTPTQQSIFCLLYVYLVHCTRAGDVPLDGARTPLHTLLENGLHRAANLQLSGAFLSLWWKLFSQKTGVLEWESIDLNYKYTTKILWGPGERYLSSTSPSLLLYKMRIIPFHNIFI